MTRADRLLRSKDIASDVQHLLALENQGRLLGVEARLAGLEGSMHAIQGLLTDLLARTEPNSPATPAQPSLCSVSSFASARPGNKGGGPATATAMTLHVVLEGAKALPRTDLVSECRAYCLLHLACPDGPPRSHRRSRTAAGSSPAWGESFELAVPEAAQALVVSVWDEGGHGRTDDFVGSALAPLAGLPAAGATESWYALRNPRLGSRLRGSAIRLALRLEGPATRGGGAGSDAGEPTPAVAPAASAGIVFMEADGAGDGGSRGLNGGSDSGARYSRGWTRPPGSARAGPAGNPEGPAGNRPWSERRLRRRLQEVAENGGGQH